jgi:hypothetical protein
MRFADYSIRDIGHALMVDGAQFKQMLLPDIMGRSEDKAI